MPVEQLRPGDLVLTASGAARPVQWLGHRSILTSRHASPQDILPIRVAAGAFAPNRPGRDLMLSPDHVVFVGGEAGKQGFLIPIRYLANGRTIRQLRLPEITYWDVELATHDVLLAEGLPCESYLDTGNRAAFANAGAVTTLHPDFARHIWDTQGCAPLHTAGPRVHAARTALLRQADTIGHTRTTEAALQVLADGTPLAAHVRGRTWRLRFPPTTKSLRIVTRSCVPNHTGAAATDTCILGVALRNLRVDGIALPLDDPRLSFGWHAIEGLDTPGGPFRWTNGNAGLSLAGANGISFDVIMTGTCWQRAPNVGRRRKQSG